MVHILGSTIIIVTIIHFFSVNYTLSNIERAYLGLYKGIAENSVIVSDSTGAELNEPVFSRTTFTTNVKAYCELEVKPICKYSLSINYYAKSGQSGLTSPYKAKVTITFYPKMWKRISRVATFQIVKGLENYG